MLDDSDAPPLAEPVNRSDAAEPAATDRRTVARRTRSFLTGAALSLALSLVAPAAAHAESDDDSDSDTKTELTQSISVQPGKATLFDRFYSLKSDCTKDGEPEIVVSTVPKHGKFSAKDGEDYPQFTSTSDFYSCNGKLVPSVRFYYNPDASYVGEDQMTVELTFPDGYVESETYKFVIKGGGAPKGATKADKADK